MGTAVTQPETVCLDLDDTLIETACMYHRGSRKCAELIAEALGRKDPHPKFLFDLLDKLDAEKLKGPDAYSLNRFPTAWTRTYEQVAQTNGVPVDPEVRERIFHAAGAFARGPFVLIDGALKTLETLQRDGHPLHLITAGDEGLQRRKIEETGIGKFFRSVNITGVNKREVMTRLRDEAGGKVFMVGDSMKSDIKPAVELGVTAVYVPGDVTWTFAQAEVDKDKYYEIESIAALPHFIMAYRRCE